MRIWMEVVVNGTMADRIAQGYFHHALWWLGSRETVIFHHTGQTRPTGSQLVLTPSQKRNKWHLSHILVGGASGVNRQMIRLWKSCMYFNKCVSLFLFTVNDVHYHLFTCLLPHLWAVSCEQHFIVCSGRPEQETQTIGWKISLRQA